MTLRSRIRARFRVPRSLTTLVLALVVTVLLISSSLFRLSPSPNDDLRSASGGGHLSLPPSLLPIVSLASSSARLGSHELAITLRSLYQQSLEPAEVRLYLPLHDKAAFERRRRKGADLLARLLNDVRLKLYYVEDIGPSTKFVYAIKEMLETGRLDQPIVVVDDDHSYSPSLVSSLVAWASIPELQDAAVGLRGWRLRRDLHWGVPQEEVAGYVQEGYTLAQPYRVSVLTANEGYLIRPQAFLAASARNIAASGFSTTSSSQHVPILDVERMSETFAHLVDDIWMAGHLCTSGIPRYVVPLLPAPGVFNGGSATPSIDVTKTHTLMGHFHKDGTSRAQANDETLAMFADCWNREALWYTLLADRGAADDQERTEMTTDTPVYLGWWSMKSRELAKARHHAKIRLLYGQ